MAQVDPRRERQFRRAHDLHHVRREDTLAAADCERSRDVYNIASLHGGVRDDLDGGGAVGLLNPELPGHAVGDDLVQQRDTRAVRFRPCHADPLNRKGNCDAVACGCGGLLAQNVNCANEQIVGLPGCQRQPGDGGAQVEARACPVPDVWSGRAGAYPVLISRKSRSRPVRAGGPRASQHGRREGVAPFVGYRHRRRSHVVNKHNRCRPDSGGGVARAVVGGSWPKLKREIAVSIDVRDGNLAAGDAAACHLNAGRHVSGCDQPDIGRHQRHRAGARECHRVSDRATRRPLH